LLASDAVQLKIIFAPSKTGCKLPGRLGLINQRISCLWAEWIFTYDLKKDIFAAPQIVLPPSRGRNDRPPLLKDREFCPHLESETYTWEWLPKDLKRDLPESLTAEYCWVMEAMEENSGQRSAISGR
jgi:hypothetical protein